MSEFPVKVGVVGCGHISGIYLQNAAAFPVLQVVACADLQPERARAKAAEFGIPRACATEELLADLEIEAVLNLTVPGAHAAVALAALESGKSVYNEKPLAIERADGQRILDLARRKKLRVGCAPDTFLGGGLQTVRKLIDEGAIGAPVAATTFMVSHGPESWHPDPEFYYQVGGGPLFDMGPYYLTALINLLGPVRRVCGSARSTFRERTITSEPKRGKVIHVEVPTHVAGVLDFASGAMATMLMTFDVWHANLPMFEIYGSAGSLSVPDPNTFGGPVLIRTQDSPDWREVPLTLPWADNCRGLGLSEMVQAIAEGRPHRASGELALHALEIMHAVHDASGTGKCVTLRSPAPRPAALAPG